MKLYLVPLPLLLLASALPARASLDPEVLFAQRPASPTVAILPYPYEPGEVLVRFRPGTSAKQAENVLTAAGAESFERRFAPGLYRALTGSDEGAMLRLMQAAAASPLVLDTSPNYRGEGGYVPNDPIFSSQWHLEQPSNIDLDAVIAWEITRGSPDTVIAVMDSGLYFSQPEFAGRLYDNPFDPVNGLDDDGNGLVDDYHGWDFVNPPDNDPSIDFPNEGHPHGTWVTSALAANTGNAFEVAGIDHRAKILQLRVLNSVNSGDMDWLMDALYYVAQRNDVDIVNMSLINFAPTPMLADALSAAADHSILVACAGNSGPGTADDRYPAAHPAVIAVSWTTATDTLATGASTGLSVDISAPGMDLSVAHASPPFLPSQFDVVRGCSIATPLVTGIGGLVKSIYPGLNRGRFLQILAASAQDLGPPGWDPEFGWGRVNAARALDYTILAYQLFHDGFETGDTSAWPVTVP